MSIKETYFNKYRGWGTCSIPNGCIEFITRNEGSVLSPSWDLINRWKNRKNNHMIWSDFIKQFEFEMNNDDSINELDRLAKLAKDKDVWLVCHCWNSRKECHRFIILDMIKRRM